MGIFRWDFLQITFTVNTINSIKYKHSQLTKKIILSKVHSSQAGMVELVDTQVSGTCGGNPVEVRVLFSAHIFFRTDTYYFAGGHIGPPKPHQTTVLTSWPFKADANGCFKIIVSLRSGPVEIISIGTPASFSIRNK